MNIVNFKSNEWYEERLIKLLKVSYCGTWVLDLKLEFQRPRFKTEFRFICDFVI